MSNRRSFFERDSRGRARIIVTSSRPRSSSRGRTTRELLNEAEEREQALVSQVSSLQTRLSFAERNEWAIRQQHQALVNQHHNCRNLQAQLDAQVREVTRLDDLLTDEEDKNERLKGKVEKLEENIRLLKRGIVEDYRGRYDTAMRDIDLLTQRLGEKNDELRVQQARSDVQERTIIALRNFLRERGYTVRI